MTGAGIEPVTSRTEVRWLFFCTTAPKTWEPTVRLDSRPFAFALPLSYLVLFFIITNDKLIFLRIIAIWNVTEIPLDTNTESPWQHSDLTTTGFTEPNLVFRENTLKQETKYSMKLIARFENSFDTSTFKLSYVTSRTPTPGSCAVRYYLMISNFFIYINSNDDIGYLLWIAH